MTKLGGRRARPRAWLFTANGEWKAVPAPWGRSCPDLWFRDNRRELVWNSDTDPSTGEPFDRWNGPWVWAYELDADVPTSDPAFRLAAVVMLAGDLDVDREADVRFVGEASAIVLLEGYPALLKFAREVSTFVRWFPKPKPRKPTVTVRTVPLDSVPEPSYEDADPDD